MSRRHHGRPHHHANGGADGPRRVTGVSPGPAGTGQERGGHVNQVPATGASIDPARVDRTPTNAAPPNDTPINSAPAPVNGAPRPDGDPRHSGAPPVNGAERPAPNAQAPNGPAGHGPGDQSSNTDRNGQCTAPQLRRFIKSRPYVPMHELRRRFGIDGADDDVTPVRLDPGWVYVGLPTREGSLLGDLLRAGEIGYELSLDPRTPIVIGVYPMRPIPRS
jgi:hypothetical protein